jgi:DNA-binding beta-propeller fold protein YncE
MIIAMSMLRYARILVLLSVSACEPPDEGADAGTRPPAGVDAGGFDAGLLGRLHVEVTGFSGDAGTLHLSGPEGFSQSFAGSRTLTGLTPGTYTLRAEPALERGFFSDALYLPDVEGSPATVVPEPVAMLKVRYTRRPGTRELWVVDASATSVVSLNDYELYDDFSGAGRASPRVKLTSPTSSGPDQLAFDASGNLWLTRPGEEAIVRYAPGQLASSGTQNPSAVLTSVGSARGLAFDTAGNLWVVSGDTLSRLPAASLPTNGTHGAAPDLVLSGGMLGARAPAFDAQGNLYVASETDGRLMRFEPSQLSGRGTVTVTPAAVFTSEELAHPRALAFDTAGDLYVVNAPTLTAGFISRFPRDALQPGGTRQLTATLRLDSEDLKDPRALAFSNGGHLWVSNAGGATVGIFSAGQLSGTGTFQVTPHALVSFSGSQGLRGMAFNMPPARLPIAR